MAVKQTSTQGSWLQGGSTSAGTTLQPAKNTVQVTAPATTWQNTYNPQTVGTYYDQPAGPAAPQNPTPAPEPAPDPYARWGGYANYKAQEDNFNQTKNLTYGSITDSINDTVAGTKSSILDYLSSYQQQQSAIDKSGVKAELGREQKRVGILDMVGSGLRNGQIMLNNANAANSSASEQIARGYGRLGQKQMIAANTGYNLEQEDIKDTQDALGIATANFKRKYGEDKVTAANTITSNAVAALSALDNQAANSGVGGDIDVESEKARIRNQATAELNMLDSIFDEGIAKIKPADRMTNYAEANKLMYGGYVPESGMGFESTLPIYTLG